MDVYYCDDKMKIIPFNYIQCCYICDVLAYVDCKRVIVWLDSLSIIKFRHIRKTYGTMLPVLGYGRNWNVREEVCYKNILHPTSWYI